MCVSVSSRRMDGFDVSRLRLDTQRLAQRGQDPAYPRAAADVALRHARRYPLTARAHRTARARVERELLPEAVIASGGLRGKQHTYALL
jgi:hypothetical protein